MDGVQRQDIEEYSKQERQCTYNVTLWGVRVMIVAMETQQCPLRVFLSCMSVSNIKIMSVDRRLVVDDSGQLTVPVFKVFRTVFL
jgi:hypothetical protein